MEHAQDGDTSIGITTGFDMDEEPKPAKKKRGRKKKEAIAKNEELVTEEQESLHLPGEALEPLGLVDPTPAEPAAEEEEEEEPVKRKRGRSKKSERPQYTDTVARSNAGDDSAEAYDVVVSEQSHAAATNLPPDNNMDDEHQRDDKSESDAGIEALAPAPRKRGRKKKGETSGVGEEGGTSKELPAGRSVLAEKPSNSQTATPDEPKAHSGKSDRQAGGKLPPVENAGDAKENNGTNKSTKEKQATTATAKTEAKMENGKVQYRVGLSKRSRITPLLKSIRK
jgi:hypothetical protein